MIPDAVLGAEPAHPAVAVMMLRARAAIERGEDAWQSGPGVTTTTLPGRTDWLVLPPGTFYPVHYRETLVPGADVMTEQPWSMARHWWAGSWLTPEQKKRHAPKQVPRTVLRMPR